MRKSHVRRTHLELRLPEEVLGYLDQLAESGVYGDTRSGVASQLLREKLREIFGEDVFVAKPPPPSPPIGFST